MNRVLGKVAIVTGSGSGLGRAEAMMFAREGAKVAVTDINDKNGMETVALIRQEGGEAEYWHLNVSVEKECADVLAKVVEKFGKLDILVNNAGITGPDVPTEEVEEADWDKMFAINVKSVLFMTKHAIQYMRKNGKGAIVNTSSVSGIIGDTELTPYHATKGTVVIMTMKDAIQYAPDHIRVNCVCPGTVCSPSFMQRVNNAPDPEAAMKNFVARQPMGRLGEPDEVARAILFAADPNVGFMTGANIVVDGAMTV